MAEHQASSVSLPRLDADSALTAGHLLGVENGGRTVEHAQAVETACGEQCGIRLPGSELGQAGVHVAPEEHAGEIRPPVQDDRPSAHGCGAHDRFSGKVASEAPAFATSTSRGSSLAERRRDASPRQARLHVLQRVDSDVDPALFQGRLQLLDEETLAPDLRETRSRTMSPVD